jgi:hypothetical protein
VTTADGRRWTVRRRIAWPQWRLRGGWLPPVEIDPTGILLLLVFPLVIAIILVVLVGAAVLVFEAAAVLVAAYVWRGRWIVEAVTDDPPPETKRVEARGWRASRRAYSQLIAELER